MDRFIDVRAVVENAMISLDDTNSRDRVIFRQWAYIAMREIGFSKVNIVEKCVPICNLSFEKPCDLVSTIEVSLKDSSGFSIRYTYLPNKGLLPVDDALVSSYTNRIFMSEDADFYYLSSNANDIVEAQIKYYALPLNDEGFPLIPEVHLLAIMSFIEFMYIKRKRASAPRSVSGQDMAEFKDAWTRERGKARGRNKMPSIHEAQHVFKNWCTLINRFSFKN